MGSFYFYFYCFLCSLRLLLVASPGYIHPDEFFQSPEVFLNPPWEFSSEHRLRSPIFPWLFSHVPMQLLPAWWFAPRVIPFFGSFVLDLLVWRSSSSREVRFRRLLLLASSWPVLVMQSRSFSNGLEAVAMALLLLLRDYSWALGAVGAAGLFARFTFPAFAIGVVTLPPSVKSVSAAVFVGVVFVAVDSAFFGMKWTVTPWNAFWYNVKTENVAQHGLHPRYLHCLVNLPMLLGPVVLSRLRPSKSWLIPILILSIIPHQVIFIVFSRPTLFLSCESNFFQEPRFLLPLVAPAISSCDSNLPSWMWGAHFVYHASATAFFGILHQGGVVPSVLALNHLPQKSHIVYWKTYPPPLHLLSKSLDIVDLKGFFFFLFFV